MARIKNPQKRRILLDERGVLLESKEKSDGKKRQKIGVVEFLRVFQNRCRTQFPLLPAGIKYCERIGPHYTGVILEEPPGLRSVPYYSVEDDVEGDSELVRLAFPYVVLGFAMCDGRLNDDLESKWVAFRTEPIVSLKDKLYFTNLWNAGGYNICLGKLSTYSPASLYEAGEVIRQTFWGNAFLENGLAGDNYDKYAEETTGSLKKWQKRSLRDPQFPLKMKWPEPPEGAWTLERLLQDMRDYVEENPGFPTNFSELADWFSETEEEKGIWMG